MGSMAVGLLKKEDLAMLRIETIAKQLRDQTTSNPLGRSNEHTVELE